MIVHILAHTSIWVYALLFGLLGFGLIQSRTRTVSKIPALLLPAGMIALSLAGIISSFGLTTIPLAAWAMALTMATAVGYTFFRDKRIHCKATDGAFFIPGSWVPLVVMMAIFCAKYGYAVMHAYNAEVTSTPMVIGALSAVYGLLVIGQEAHSFSAFQCPKRTRGLGGTAAASNRIGLPKAVTHYPLTFYAC